MPARRLYPTLRPLRRSFDQQEDIRRLDHCLDPLFRSERFRRATDDRFFIVVEASDPKFDSNSTPAFLESLGGIAVEAIEDVDDEPAAGEVR